MLREPREQTRREENREPLHERLQLNRRSSRRNLAPRREDNYGETQKDREIRELKNLLEIAEREKETAEQVTNHYSLNNNTPPAKNETRAQSGKGPKEANMNEMREFLKDVMRTISAFETQLNSQTDSNAIHSDRS
jgi:hypothetical protein